MHTIRNREYTRKTWKRQEKKIMERFFWWLDKEEYRSILREKNGYRDKYINTYMEFNRVKRILKNGGPHKEMCNAYMQHRKNKRDRRKTNMLLQSMDINAVKESMSDIELEWIINRLDMSWSLEYM